MSKTPYVLVVIIVFVHGYQIRTRRPTGGGGELSAAPLADHTINWLQDNIQRIDVQRPLLIAAGSDYIRHGDLLLAVTLVVLFENKFSH